MNQTEIDGVRTLWADLPGQFAASLVFNVGARDASFLTARIPHLVEHLAMNGLPRTHSYRNASVDLSTTDFKAAGEPEEVVEFLMQVCRNLHALPWHEAERELRVLEREDSSSVHPALAWALSARFGLRGPGVSNTDGPFDTSGLTESIINEYARTYFVRENAVLVLSKPPPDDLRLALPSGRVNRRTPTVRTDLQLPAIVHDQVPRTVLSFELPDAIGARASVTMILEERVLDEARHRRGLIYGTVSDSAALCGEDTVVVVQADPSDADAGEVLGIMWSTLNELADHGPTEEEVDRVRRGFTAYLDNVDARFDFMEGFARELLENPEPRGEEELRAIYAALSPAQVQAWASVAVRTTLASVPGALEEEPSGLRCLSEELSTPPRFEGEVYRRRLTFGSRGRTLTANSEGLAGRFAGGRWSDVVGVGMTEGVREVVFANGWAVEVSTKHMRNGGRLIEIIDDRVGHLAFPMTAEAH